MMKMLSTLKLVRSPRCITLLSILFLGAFWCLESVNAQQLSVPDAFQFQGVAKDLEGTIMVNQEMTLRVTILKGSETGEEVFQETHLITTNESGYFSIAIGEGQITASSTTAKTSRSASLSTVEWGSAPHFITYEIDLNDSGSFEPLGTSRLLSVPYAMVSGTTVNSFDPNDFPELSRIEFLGDSANGSVLIATDQGLLLEKTVAIGEATLQMMRSGYSNTAVGFGALKQVESGSGNTAVGANAGITLTGSESLENANGNNTFIGAGSDAASSELTNASAIGAGAIVGASNLIQLGNTDVERVVTSGMLQAGEVVYPNQDGSVGQVLATDGEGQLVWKEDKTGAEYGAGGALKLEDGEFSIVEQGVTRELLADSAVTSAKLADGAVSTAKLSDGSVTSAKLANASVTEKILADRSVTAAKLAPGLTDLVNDSTPQLGGNLDLNGRAIVTSNGSDLVLRPGEGGQIVLDSLRLPQGVGSAGQLLATDGSGQLSWQNPQAQSYSAGSGLTLSGNQFSVTTGGISQALLANGAVSATKIADGSVSTTKLADGSVNTSKLANASITSSKLTPGLTDLVNDTTPQLGGNLDINGRSITSTGNGDIILNPDGTGQVVISNLRFPNIDGGGGQILSTDGNGNLQFVNRDGTAQIVSNQFIYDRNNFESGLLLGDTTITGTLNDARMNVGIGSATFNALTEGDYNVAIGRNLLTNVTTGFANVYIGGSYYPENLGNGETESQMTTGFTNIGIGIGAMEDITTQRANIGIGIGAGKGATDGNANIFIGTETGYGNGLDHTKTFTPGDGNVVIGAQAKISATPTQSPTIDAAVVIGNSADVREAYGLAAGSEAVVGGVGSVAIGYQTNALGENSIAIGPQAVASSANTVALGNTSIDSVITSGLLKLGDIIYPNTDGTAGQILTTNGSGALSWQNAPTTSYTAGTGLSLSGNQFSIATGGVTSALLGDGAVTAAKILDGTVSTTKLSNASITTDKLADVNVTTAKLADNSVTSAKLVDSTITGVDLATGAVTTPNLADGVVTLDKLSITGTPTSGQSLTYDGTGLAFATVGGSTYTASTGLSLSGSVFSIASGGVTSALLGDGAVTAAKILDGTVSTTKLSNASITTDKLADVNVTTAKLADNSVTSAKLDTSLNISGAMTARSFSGSGEGLSSIPLSGLDNVYYHPTSLSLILGHIPSSIWSTAGKNLALGSGALSALSSGGENIAIGVNSGSSITYHTKNTIIGSSAGKSGFNNTIIGYSAATNLTGSSNTIIGETAAPSLTGGSSNIIIGDDAGQTFTSMNYSVVIGSATAGNPSNTQGGQNVIIGYQSKLKDTATLIQDAISIGFATESADEAIALGRVAKALGDNSIAIGASASAAGTSGIAFGQSAVADGLNSIAIGKFANTNQDYTIVIGNISGTADSTIYLGGNEIVEVRSAGTIVAPNVSSSSDRRLKRNLEPLANASSLLADLTPYQYQKKRNLSSTDFSIQEIGLIAQDVQNILPFLVSEGSDEDHILSLDYNSFIGLLIKAHQEQEEKISLYQTELENQKTILEKQQRQLDAQQTLLQELMNRLEKK